MKSLLRVELLEPRALLAGLCDMPSNVLPAPVESMPAPAAEVGAMRGGADGLDGLDGGVHAPLGPAIDTDFAPPPSANPGLPPHVNLPSDSSDPNADQGQTPSLLDPPGKAELTGPNVESGSTDPNPLNRADLKGNTGNSGSTDLLSPSCKADTEPVVKSAATPTPSGDSPARVASPPPSPFVSLFITASPTPQVEQLVPSPNPPGNSIEATSKFHYFEPISASRHDGGSLDSEPLADVAMRETFVAFWLMTKKDLDDLQGQHDAIGTAESTTHATSSEPSAAQQQVEKCIAAVTQQTDVVHKALAAISSADDVLRQADAARALALNRTAAPTPNAETAIAQTLACTDTRSDPLTSQQASACQPNSPRWQLGMCSLVSILFSFRAPTKSLDKPTVTRKSFLRANQRTT